MKKKIDLKALLREVHGVDRERELVKEYRESFLGALEEDEGLAIVGVLGDSRKVIGKSVGKIRGRYLDLKKREDEYLVNLDRRALEEAVVKSEGDVSDGEDSADERWGGGRPPIKR